MLHGNGNLTELPAASKPYPFHQLFLVKLFVKVIANNRPWMSVTKIKTPGMKEDGYNS